MMDQQGRSPEDHTAGSTPRRAVVRGAAWSIPVIAAAVAAPYAAASGAGVDGIPGTAVRSENATSNQPGSCNAKPM